MNVLASSPLAHIALRAGERLALGILLGLALWAVNAPALAQPGGIGCAPRPGGCAPELPANRVQLVLRADALLLTGADGVERFALAGDGTVELSGTATIDFSPAMQTFAIGTPAGAIRVRVGGRTYLLQLFEDGACGPGGCAR